MHRFKKPGEMESQNEFNFKTRIFPLFNLISKTPKYIWSIQESSYNNVSLYQYLITKVTINSYLFQMEQNLISIRMDRAIAMVLFPI
jgi:hypothetical protein